MICTRQFRYEKTTASETPKPRSFPGLLYISLTNKPRRCWSSEVASCVVMLERVMGIEPTFKAWEALVLPLNYTREFIQPSSMNSCTQPSASEPCT